ncbi:lipoprotein signal peptidase [Cellulomonas chitinilytica]|uniref:Lipoprotein signal peptidase n=1 Tax=Cellulomonas chitinilytica TaxID=398759 RepID=A0A919P8C7_9CELL|nr:signal peptidase II [Cellulomonas chitinilytica]GIG23149.1 lipoprotein signal peptidase [Cellulomonas chitinilytica]
MPTTTDDEPVETQTTPARRRHLLTTLVVITVVVLAVDQLSKVWALAALEGEGRRDLLGSLLGFELVRNPGAALSIATGMTWLLTLVAVGVVVVIVRAARRIGSMLWAVALGLLLGGALGNLVDRLFRAPGVARGHVVDFIAYGNWFVGNVADIAIVVAAVLVVLLAMLGIRIDGTRERDDDTSGDPDGPHDDAPGDELASGTQVDEPAGDAPADELADDKAAGSQGA